MGWYENGFLYDKEGKIAGARQALFDRITKSEPNKEMQKMSPMKPIITGIRIKPMFSRWWSSTPLIELLYFGKK